MLECGKIFRQLALDFGQAPLGAADNSPRRKPWGGMTSIRRKPREGRQKSCNNGPLDFYRPSRGFEFSGTRCPTAYAVGYYLPPFRGWRNPQSKSL